MRSVLTIASLFLFALIAASCGSDTADLSVETEQTTGAVDAADAAVAPTEDAAVPTTPPVVTDATPATEPAPTQSAAAEPAATQPAATVRVRAEVWADNWFALYANGVLVGEDSVPITTERSFNAETIEFEATLPLTLAFEAKDFKETDSGIEYIGQNNQQMGDGGIIAQFTDLDTGEVLAVTNGSWQALAIHRAPLNKDCEKAADPDTACQTEIIAAPDAWAAPGFDASGWAAATEWSEADVSPKDGYDRISWTSAAALIWGTDLEIDNTVLLRTTVLLQTTVGG